MYSLLTFAFGPSSFKVQKHLESEIERVSQHLASLEAAHKNYLNTAASLVSDAETLSLHMRQLGYGQPDEKFIRIIGLENYITPEMSPGQVLRVAEGDFVSDKSIKITALIFALVMLVFFFTVDLLTLAGSRRN